MAETLYLYSSEKDPELQSRAFTFPIKGEVDAGAELYVDKVSLRVRLDDYFGSPEQVMHLVQLHLPNWTEKIIIKSRPADRLRFSQAGFREEAFVRGYFSGMDMHFMTAYPVPKRGISEEIKIPSSTRLNSTSTQQLVGSAQVPILHTATSADAEELARFYSLIFPVYPTPIAEPDYLKKVIAGDSMYKYIKQDGTIVSAACAEINRKYGNAELSDCGTLPTVTGKGYMKAILSALLVDLKEQEIKSIYSIARSDSAGMNAVFKSLGFDYTGTLIKNVYIFSGFEDMRVWSLP